MKRVIFVLLILILAACNTPKNKEEEAVFQRHEEKHVEHYPNGVKKLEGVLVNGKRHGKWTFYYDNGFVWSEGKFKHGKRDGYSVVYYKDGRTKLRGQYENDLQVGKWEIFDSKGKLAKVIDLNEMLSADDSLKLGLK